LTGWQGTCFTRGVGSERGAIMAESVFYRVKRSQSWQASHIFTLQEFVDLAFPDRPDRIGSAGYSLRNAEKDGLIACIEKGKRNNRRNSKYRLLPDTTGERKEIVMRAIAIGKQAALEYSLKTGDNSISNALSVGLTSLVMHSRPDKSVVDIPNRKFQNCNGKDVWQLELIRTAAEVLYKWAIAEYIWYKADTIRAKKIMDEAVVMAYECKYKEHKRIAGG